MIRTRIHISPPKSFRFRTLLYSHGWRDLEPFRVSEDDTELRCVIPLTPATHVAAAISEGSSGLKVAVESKRPLSANDKVHIAATVRSMFRMDDSMDEFYNLCRTEPQLRWIPKIGGGRMLRSATVFEDIVKMICTTNCSWSLTKIITSHIASKLGTPVVPGIWSFPSPHTLASQTERWMRKETSSGYRAPYLLEFAERVASGALSVEHLRTESLPTDDVYVFLRSIKGVGHYAAGNLLKLLGHYDYLSIDSWIRSQFSAIRKRGRKVSDASIEKYYAHYGKWRGLVCWMDMTKSWHV